MLLRRLLSSEASLGTSAKTLSSFYARTPGAHGFASSAQVTEFLGTTTKKFENGPKAELLFSAKEYESRLSKLRKNMGELDVSACLFTSMHNTCYFSNFVYCSFGRPYGLVVGGEPGKGGTSLSAMIDGGQPWRRTFGDNLIYTDWQRDNYFRAIKESLGDVEGNIGVEFDHMNLETKRKLSSLLPNCTLVDVSKVTARQRMIKSKEEIEVIKLGAATADIGGWACREAAKEGAQEWEVAGAGVAAMQANIANRAGEKAELMDTWVWFQSGLNTDGAHNPLTNRRLQNGDILSLNCFPMIQGYYTALERTMFLGQPDDASLRYWEANVAVHKRGLELIKPGAKCREIAAELNDLFASFDMLNLRSFGYGHSFGVLSHYFGREEGLELREDIDTVLEPGMVVSMEPMITVADGQPGAGGYREHDILVIEEDGTVENITKFPFGPEHNIIPV